MKISLLNVRIANSTVLRGNPIFMTVLICISSTDGLRDDGALRRDVVGTFGLCAEGSLNGDCKSSIDYMNENIHNSFFIYANSRKGVFAYRIIINQVSMYHCRL